MSAILACMYREGVQALCDLAEALVAATDNERVRVLLEGYEAGDIDFAHLVDEIRALHRPVQ